jgi:recombination protein RecT
VSDRTTSYSAQEQGRRDDMKTIVATIDAQRDKYAGILPSNVKFDDFRNAFLIAVQINPRLLEADRQSLWLALQKCASGGLKPDNVEAALVIFGDDEEDEDGNRVASAAKGKKKVVYMPMVWGITKQMRNTGNVASVRAKVIYRGEHVLVTDEDGKETYKHTRTIEAGSDVDETDENVVGAYAVVTYKDGFWDAEFMSRRQISRVQARAKSKRGPWATHFPQQCMKTALRRLSLRVEKSAENARYFQAIQNDETLQTIDGDPVVETPQPVLEQDNSIKQEFTKPPPEKEKVQRQPKQETKQPPKQEAPRQEQPKTHGSPELDEDAAKLVAMGQNPGPTIQDLEQQPVEIWALEDTGEPLEGQQEPMTAMEFAEWFAKRIFVSHNTDGLREHNADNIAECRPFPEAFSEINDAIGRHIKRQMEAQADAENAARAKAAAEVSSLPGKRVPVAVPHSVKGAQHWGNYGQAAFLEIAKLKDEADILDWIAVNQPTYKNRVSEIAIDNRIRLRREQLNPPTGGVVDQPMTDAEFATAAEAQIAMVSTDEELVAWAGKVASVMNDLRGRDRPLWQKICDLVDERRVALTAPA